MSRACVILCGGKSKRMKSPKALLPFGDGILLEYQVKRFSSYFDKIYISVSSQIKELLDEASFSECTFITDEHEAIGPMGGLYSVLKNSGEDTVFFTSVDSPFTDISLAADMYDTLKANPDMHAFALKDMDGRLQPLFCVYSSKCLADISKSIADKDYRLRNIFKDGASLYYEKPLPADHFFNMNDPASYYQALKKLSLKEPANLPFDFNKKIRADSPFALSFAAKSGTGKTTYLEGLIPELKKRGLKIAVIKHDAHGFEIDKPGKDSFRLRKAGADEVILSSSDKTFSVRTHPEGAPELFEIISEINDADLIITEGYKFESLPKVCLLRRGYSEDPEGSKENIIAYASDFDYETSLPVFDLNAPADITDFIIDHINKYKEETAKPI